MPLSSSDRADINRKNARKSTGPKTPKGKARSSKNALKHGLAARTDAPLPDEDADAYHQHLALWIDDLQPDDVAQRALVVAAARAAWRIERCHAFEDAGVAERARDAGASHNVEESGRARMLGHKLLREPLDLCRLITSFDAKAVEKAENMIMTEPAPVAAELAAFTHGADWLLQEWDVLLRVLDDTGGWRSREKFSAISLLGRRFEDARFDPFVAAIFNACNVANPETWDHWDEIYRERLNVEAYPKSQDEARAYLRSIVVGEVARLTELKATKLKARAEVTRAGALDRAWFDTGTSATLLLRYESVHCRDLHRSLIDLTKLRKDAASAAAPRVEGRDACRGTTVRAGAAEGRDVSSRATLRSALVRPPRKSARAGVSRPTPDPSRGVGVVVPNEAIADPVPRPEIRPPVTAAGPGPADSRLA